MRENESPDALPPEAIARMQREAEEAQRRARNEDLSLRWGMGLMSFGALVVGAPVLLNGTIEYVAAGVGIIIMLGGGLLSRPQTFEKVTQWVIAALPGGKE